jgi:probable phosphoglycerate mutase
MRTPEITLDLVRHAESDMNVAMADPTREPFIGGRQNHVPLSPDGRVQAAGFGHYEVAEDILPDVVYFSPAERTKQTCRISLLAARLALRRWPRKDLRLQELDQGDFTDRPRTLYDDPAIKAQMAAQGSRFRPPGGESMYDVANRMELFLGTVVRRHGGGDRRVQAHTHGVAIKALVGRLLGWSHEQTYKAVVPNVSLTRIVKVGRLWQVVSFAEPTVTTGVH